VSFYLAAQLLPDSQPAYVASWIYVFGAGSLAALGVAIVSGFGLVLVGPDWWHYNPVGHFFNSRHAQARSQQRPTFRCPPASTRLIRPGAADLSVQHVTGLVRAGSYQGLRRVARAVGRESVPGYRSGAAVQPWQ
jgi:hypothetical protein